MRLFMEIEDALVERALPYIKDESALKVFTAIAFEEWVVRHEARDRRAQEERVLRDRQYVLSIIQDLRKENLL